PSAGTSEHSPAADGKGARGGTRAAWRGSVVRVLDGLFGCSSLGANRRRARRSQIAVLGSGDALTVEDAKPRTRFMLMAGKPDGEKPVYTDRTSTDAISTVHLARVMDQQLRDDWVIIDQPHRHAALGPTRSERSAARS